MPSFTSQQSELVPNRSKIILNYSVTLLLTFTTANTILHTPFYSKILLLIIFVLYIIYGQTFKKSDIKFVIMIFYVLIILIIQAVQFGTNDIKSIFSVLVTFILPFLALKITGPEILTKYFVRVMYILTLISFCFYFPMLLYPGLYTIIQETANNFQIPYGHPYLLNESLIIYNIGVYKSIYLENPGPFWEGGAFGTFIALALLINTFQNKSFFNKVNITFIIGLLTTFSTAAFVFLFVYIFFMTVFLYKKLLLKILLIPVLLYFGFFIYKNFELLGPKIQEKYSTQMSADLFSSTGGRFFAFRRDLISISRHPVFGRGLSWESQAGLKSDERGGYTFMIIAAKMGIVPFVIYIFYLFNFFKINRIINNSPKGLDIFAFFSILILLFTQSVEFSSIYLILIYISIFYKNQILLNSRTISICIK